MSAGNRDVCGKESSPCWNALVVEHGELILHFHPHRTSELDAKQYYECRFPCIGDDSFPRTSRSPAGDESLAAMIVGSRDCRHVRGSRTGVQCRVVPATMSERCVLKEE